MIWDKLAKAFKLGFEKLSGEELVDGKCPKCGDNLVNEFGYIICCNGRCGFCRRVKR